MRDLVIFAIVLSVIGTAFLLQWSIQNKLLEIYVHWGSILGKLYENLVFGTVITPLLIWFQILVFFLVHKNLKGK
ncbi:hypothetical protein CCZ20_27655 [Priestia aryabhattai]|uniref:hypothetical protein n=1 Tax=Priestia TaxID=2800373 RepID=UPI000B51290D|nr:hypothetical protein [Priestia aryabhattai]MBZ6485175.1 hypothetical protein [Priestia aryabhattai]OVE34221.1 hypothetical protein CCZ20_27655 [Priestia aryabhattai]